MPLESLTGRVVYIGSDTGYRNTISHWFKSSYPDQKFEFHWLTLSNEGYSQELFSELLDLEPSIIYVDFTENPQAMLLFTEFLGRDNFFTSVPLVGLSENKEEIRTFLGAGVDFIFVKGGEVHDVIYAPMTVAFPNIVKKPEFARGEIHHDTEIIDDLRISYITQNYLHAEGNFLFEEGQLIDLDTGIPQKNISSDKFKVNSITNDNLYYNFEYGYNLDFTFVDEPEFQEVDHEDILREESDEKKKIKMIKEIKAKRQDRMDAHKEQVRLSRKRHKEWLKNFVDSSIEKKVKVLVVDKRMRILKDNSLNYLDRYPFCVYCQTFLKPDLSDIEVIRPSVIGIELMSEFNSVEDKTLNINLDRLTSQGLERSGIEDLGEEERITEEIQEKKKEELAWLSKVIKKIKSLDNYSPILVLFRAHFLNSKALQETYSYSMIMTHDEHINMDVLANLVDVYEKKQDQKRDDLIKVKLQELKKKFPLKYRHLGYQDFIELRYYINKKNPLSFCSVKSPITLKTLTESEITFLSEIELPEKTFRMNFPLAMSIHLIPIEEDKLYIDEDGSKLYRALIHSISEVDKKELRRYVNEVFFEPLSQEREQEKDNYWERHNKILEEKRTKPKPLATDVEDQLSLNRIDRASEPGFDWKKPSKADGQKSD